MKEHENKIIKNETLKLSIVNYPFSIINFFNKYGDK